MENPRLQTIVGLFVIVGLALMGALIVQFGKVGQIYRPSYEFNVNFQNGGGLIKGGQVRFAGILAGRICQEPRLVETDRGQFVQVRLQVYEDFKIMNNARITVSQSGMLGDAFVDIVPRPSGPGDAPARLIAAGDTVSGTSPFGLGDLTADGADLMTNLKAVAKRLDEITTKVNAAMTPETIQNSQQTLENLRKVSVQVEALMQKINRGEGAVGTLLNDPKTAENIKALVYNLKKEGILFYSDAYAAEKKAEGKPQPKPRTSR
ncbi:MAG: MlaD family protein [Verrucomicrobiae bacterium]|nr:MlaD family protein [Verrucomicrobiae bacterium]